jgi:REP element-mobilizing transposase RayT
MKTEEIRRTMWDHIHKNARKKGIFIDVVNGYSQHCHCLISLAADQTIRKTMHLIKGESSHWFNTQNFIDEQFQWQDEYYAMSVSESMIPIVRNYILKQEQHHQKRPFKDEYEELFEKYGFVRIKDSKK